MEMEAVEDAAAIPSKTAGYTVRLLGHRPRPGAGLC